MFSAVHEIGAHATVAQVAEKIKAPERSTRMLLDFLALEGFFVKANGTYACTPSTSMFLVKSSPAYIASSLPFLASEETTKPFQDFAAVVRAGTTSLPAGGTTAPDAAIWVKFARGMVGFSMGPAQMLANFPDVLPAGNEPLAVLDVAAGHGIYGIHVAKKLPTAKITFLDWAAVLEVCKEHVTQFGVPADRCSYIAGSAFDVDLKGPYDVILLTNILHHFDHATNVKLIKRMVAALKPAGRIITLEFVPNEERTAPPNAVMFPLMMLGTTPAGDAYTMSQFDSMFKEAGIAKNKLVPLPTGSSFIVSTH